MKKTLFSIITASAIFTTQAHAVYSVYDASAVAQMARQYSQQAQDYANQLKQYQELIMNTLNWQKQLERLGVDMNSIQQIIGDAMNAINSIEQLYQTITDMPDNLKNQWNKISEVCNFLQQNSSGFSSDISKLSSQVTSIFGNAKSQVESCIKASTDPTAINKTLADLSKSLEKVSSIEEKERIRTKIQNIEAARAYLKQEAMNTSTLEAINQYEEFFSDVNGKQSKVKENTETLKQFQKQLKKDLNEKQQAALTNSLLLKMLETAQMTNQIQVSQQRLLAQISQTSSNKNELTNNDFKQQARENKFAPQENNFKIKVNEYGLPIWGQ